MVGLGKAVVLSCYACLALSARMMKRARSPDVDGIPCPVLAALTSQGFISPDESGKVAKDDILQGLMKIGCSPRMSFFQAAGAANYKASDIHQNEPVKFSPEADRWINLRSLRLQDVCRKGGPEFLPGGIPCSTNPEFNQHAFSTKVRDPAYSGSIAAKFDAVFNKPGIFKWTWRKGRVLTFEGMSKLFKIISEEGDFNGEFSSGNIEFYHPSITDAYKKKTLSQWQALSAFAMLMAAFGHEDEGFGAYLTRAEVRSLFIKGQIPSGWTMRQWGFLETFKNKVALKGFGFGEEWGSMVENSLNTVGWDADEETLFYQFAGMLAGLGASADSVVRTYPPGRD